MSTIHTTVGVYPNREFKINGVKAENLESHIEYNRLMRPGRALLVDGTCILIGNFNQEDVTALEEEFKDCKRSYDTAPYV